MQRTYQLSEIAPSRAEGEFADLLRKRGRIRRFAAGALIQQQGDDGDGFCLIETGTVAMCRFAESGSVTVYAVLGPGDLFGELAHFAGVPRQVDAVADEDAELIWIGASLIDHLLETEPQFARWLLKSIANQLRIALDRIDEDSRLSARVRVVRALVDMARRDGAEIDMTQQALGELLGISRITAGQILRELQAAGLLRLEYRRIVVTGLAGLAALGG